MTLVERADAVAALGFTARQARFLTLVALHGGYCMRRQYEAFARVRMGKNVRAFFEGLVIREFASRVIGRADRGFVYHLHSRTLYRAIGEEHNRNRRPVSPAHITRKLMVLDFVLTQSAASWYATEREKVALFSVQFGLPLAAMPHRVFRTDGHAPDCARFFIHKLPIFIPPDSTRPHFVYLAASPSAAEFEGFLHDHDRLFRALGSWTVVVLCDRRHQALEDVFHRFSRTRLTSSGRDELAWLFERQRALDQNNFAHIPVSEIQRFRELRRNHDPQSYNAAYASWLETGRVADDAASQPEWNSELRWEPFATSYEQFSSLPGVA